MSGQGRANVSMNALREAQALLPLASDPVIRRVAIALDAREAEGKLVGDRALQFLTREGYRRCDVAECNCGEWHKEKS